MPNLFIDNFSTVTTSHYTWIGLYLMLAVLVVKNNKTVSQILFIMSCGILGVALSCFYSYEESFKFSLVAYFSLLTRSRALTTTLFAWAIVGCVCNVHLDCLTGLEAFLGSLYGLATGSLIYIGYYYVMKRISPYGSYVSSQYTSTGYDHRDLDATISIIMLTVVYITFRSLI